MSAHSIHILSEKVANLIAAGEVVERPASVVKELIENSLDADASAIEVEIKQAGIAYIRVTDDGSGMLPADAQLAFSRHATSKIKQAEDLENIVSLGFRGEALPSIAAVSRVELLTRPQNQTSGFRMKIVGGAIKTKQEAGCAPGTSFIVEDLFFNTPARRKFLKSHATEQARILQAVEMSAIANPQVGFKMLVDKREIFNCPQAATLRDRLVSLFGNALPAELLPVEREGGGVWIRGLIAGPKVHKNTRQDMHFYINGRSIEHRGLAHAVTQVYQGLIPGGRYPVCFLFLEMPNSLVDVNVHPAKREVRLRDEQGVYRLVQNAVQDAMQRADLTGGQIKLSPIVAGQYPVQEPLPSWSAGRVRESVATYLNSGDTPTPAAYYHSLPNEKNARPAGDDDIRIIGQVGKTYIAAQDQKSFFLVDQHAAHERILYETLKNQPANLPRQTLLLPLTFDIKPSQTSWLKENLSRFDLLGLELSHMGGNTFSIQTQPQLMPKGNLIEIVTEIVDWALGHRQAVHTEFREKTLQSMACKAAVKSGERMQPENMQTLIRQVLEIKGLLTCPHGRPIVFRLTWAELDKIFKRDYPG